MKIEDFISLLGVGFFAGVPDSTLKPLGNYLMQTYGIHPQHHIIAANEGNATAIAAGYQLATGKVPAVYLQNSGEGNIINPVASLLSDKVYGIPMFFIIGWRGKPGVADEPQHAYQGTVTLKLLADMDIASFVLDKETAPEELSLWLKETKPFLDKGKCLAIVVQKGALSYDIQPIYMNDYRLSREAAIRHIITAADKDFLIATTGKASRELFELREASMESHERDFLTVGSMGHCSSIALGIALSRPKRRIWCLDGDGAALMHLGAMTAIGALHPPNLVHIVINNGAHESVGGLPTAASQADFSAIARACGYEKVISVADGLMLEQALAQIKKAHCLCFLEIKCAIGSRDDLGRPTISPMENKQAFTDCLR